MVKLSSKKLGGFSLEKDLTLPLVTASLLLGLVDDLIISLETFIVELKKNNKYAEECWYRIEECMGRHEYSTIDSAWVRDEVKKQIKAAWYDRAGKMDSKGNIVEWYQNNNA